jgi:hypothetical protein
VKKISGPASEMIRLCPDHLRRAFGAREDLAEGEEPDGGRQEVHAVHHLVDAEGVARCRPSAPSPW